MAKYKLDTSKIEGFESMSAEDKVAALLGQEIEVDDRNDNLDTVKLKNALNKACEEAASYKKALREKQTEAERAEAERAEAAQKMQDELTAYRNKERIASNKAQLMTAGIDPNTADLMANALPDGVKDEYFAALKQFLETQKQALLSESLNKQPGLSVGAPPSAGTADKDAENKNRKYWGLPPR